ncbi:MAG: hypothetical protein ACYCZW_03510 [Minisyncoccota bacterium]
MFNLIPTFLKKEIRSDYKGRRIIMWLGGFLMVIITSYFFLLPGYINVFFEEKNASTESKVIKDSTTFVKADEIAKTIVEINEQLKTLSLVTDSVEPISPIEKIISTKNLFIHINEIEYRELTATTSTIILTGVADKRDALREFVSNLELVDGFSGVILPVSNFAKDKDIEFTISINLI